MAEEEKKDTSVDPLGLTEKENLQIDALKAGATPSDVASLSRQSEEAIPREVPTYSLEDEDGYFPDPYAMERLPMSATEAARKSLNGSLAESGDVVSSYSRMYDQFRATGNSALYDSIRQTTSRAKELELRLHLDEVARQGDVDATQALLEGRERILAEEANTHLVAMENAATAYTERSGGYLSEENQRRYLQQLTTSVDAAGETVYDKIGYILDEAIQGNNTSGVSQAIDILDSAFLGEQALGLAKVGKDIFGERYTFAGGDLLRDLAREVRNAPTDEEKIKVAKRIVDSVTKHAGVTEDNDVVKTFFLEDFRRYLNTPGGDIPTERWMANIFGTIEAAGLVPVASSLKLIKRLGKLKGSSSATMKFNKVGRDLQVANPDLDAALNKQAIESPEVAETLGTTQAEALARSYPSNSLGEGIVLDGASPALEAHMQGIKTSAEEALEVIANTYIYADADYANKQLKITEALNSETFFGKAKPTFSTLRRSDDNNSVIVEAIYGVHNEVPLSLSQAKRLQNNAKSALSKEGVIDPKVEMLVRDPLTGTYSPYDKALHGGESSFYVKIETEAPMRPGDIVGRETIGNYNLGAMFGDYVGNMFLEHDKFVDKTIIDAARVALDAKGRIRHKLQKIASPYLDLANGNPLNWDSARKVSNVLVRGDQKQKVYNVRELTQLGLDDREVAAYYSARYLNDAVYEIKNSAKRQELLEKGYKGVTITTANGNTFSNAVKDVELAEVLGNAKSILDPYTGRFVPASSDSIQDMVAKGFTVKRLKSQADVNGGYFDYIFALANDVHELPQKVIAHRKGYMFRINKAPYFIDQEVKTKINGIPSNKVRTIHVANSSHEAAETLKELKRIDPTGIYRSRLDRNIDDGESALQSEINNLNNSGLSYWFSSRGAPLKTLAGELGAIEDPISSMHSMISSTANISSHGEMLEAFITRHRKTYGNLKNTNGDNLWRYDTNLKDYKFHLEEAVTSGDPQVATAVSEYRYLEHLKYLPTKTDLQWKKTLAGIDKMFAKLGSTASRVSAKTTLELAKHPAGAAARNATFALTIPLRPLRHLLMQGQTGAHLFGVDPKISALSYRDATFLVTALATSPGSPRRQMVQKAAAAMGLPKDEFEELLESFRQSGKAYTIDSNVAVGEANFSWARSMPETKAGQAGQLAGNLLKSPIAIGKTIGFDFGELINQATTYSFALRRWKKANPGKQLTQRAKDEITAEARNFSIDMTRTSQFAYQKGSLAAATQFMAINHKMLLKLLGQDKSIGKVGSAAHARYCAGLFAMYGAAGLGSAELYDSWIKESGIDVPPQLDNALHSGMIGFMLNSSLDLAFGEEWGTTRLDVGGSLSPSNSAFTFLPDFVSALMEGNIVEAFGGPSAQVLPNVYEAHKELTEMWAITDDLSTPERVIESFQAAIENFGSFSDYYKYNIAMAYNEKMGTFATVDSEGRPTTLGNTWTELFGKLLFGLQLRSEKELYEKHLDLYRDTEGKSKKFKSSFEKDVDSLKKYMYDTWLKYNDIDERTKRQMAIAFALHGGNRDYGYRVYLEAKKRFIEAPQYDLFVADIVKRHGILDKNYDITKMKNAVRASDAVEENEKQALIDYIDTLGPNIEAGRQIIEETF